jgi:MFS family permease
VAVPAAPSEVRLESRFPALQYPNYRLWFVGQMIATFGQWTQMTAQSYLIYELTGSPEYLGYVAFFGGIPMIFLSPFAGVLADRVPRRTLLLITQVLMMVLAFILAALTFLGVVQPWHVLVLAFLVGIVGAVDMPARQSFTLELVERDDLANAIALNATMFNAAVFVGPAVAGYLYELAGPGWCFLVNGVAFTAQIAALLVMKLKPFVKPWNSGSVLKDLRAGLGYVLTEPMVLALLILVGSVSLFGMAFMSLTPAWAVDILGGDATTNGLLQSARGLGSLVGALWIAALGRFSYKGRIMMVGAFSMPLTLLVFSQIHSLPVSLLVLAVSGLAFIPIVSLANALVQARVPDALRGRVMGVYAVILMGMFPFGGLWAGWVAQWFNEPLVPIIGGIVTLATALGLFVFVPRLRHLE